MLHHAARRLVGRCCGGESRGRTLGSCQRAVQQQLVFSSSHAPPPQPPRRVRSSRPAAAAVDPATAAADNSSIPPSSSSAAAAAHADTSSSSSSSGNTEEAMPEMQLQLPPPANSLVKVADFVKSSVEVAQCPPPRFPEFAVIGRSNVGKSSLINMLTNRKSLAMVSKQPGKTRCINHFRINDSWYLVDLPGYGYARRGKQDRADFETFTQAYFKQRATLAMVLLLVDCSIPPQDVDLEYCAWLARAGLPFSIVFTKADKRKKGEPRYVANITAFKRALLQTQGFTLLPPSLVTSSSTGTGKQELLNYIASLRVLFEQQRKAGSSGTTRLGAAAVEATAQDETDAVGVA